MRWTRTLRFHPGERQRAIEGGDLRHAEFLAGADLVIHDAQYLAEEFAPKAGWGHSTVEYALHVARTAGVAVWRSLITILVAATTPLTRPSPNASQRVAKPMSPPPPKA